MLQTRKMSATPVAAPNAGTASPLLRPSNPADATVESPARRRQELVEAVWGAPAAPEGRRWSPRATLAVSGGIALALWGVIGLAIYAIR